MNSITLEDILEAEAKIEKIKRNDPFEQLMNEKGMSLYNGDYLVLSKEMEEQLIEHKAAHLLHANIRFSSVLEPNQAVCLSGRDFCKIQREPTYGLGKPATTDEEEDRNPDDTEDKG